MVEIKYTGSLSGVRVESTIFPSGEATECDAELAEVLLERPDFDLADPPKPSGKGKTPDTGANAE